MMSDMIYIMYTFMLPLIFIITIAQGVFTHPTDWVSVGVGGGFSAIWFITLLLMMFYDPKRKGTHTEDK